jgi:hypothetical protein
MSTWEDEGAEEEEEEELLDQSFILRLPERLAKTLRDTLKKLERTGREYERFRNSASRTERQKYAKIHLAAQEAVAQLVRIEPAVDPTTNEELGDERFHFYFGKECYPAKLFNLPCITETYASADRLGPVKVDGPRKVGWGG